MERALVGLFVLMIKYNIKELNYYVAGEDHPQHLMSQKLLVKDLTRKYQILAMTRSIYSLKWVIIFYLQKSLQHLL